MALLTLFNRVYKSGQYPAAWRKGTIYPILKAGKDPAFMSSYRSIQLTSCLGKLFEKLVKVRMNYRLESEKLLNSKQSRFRSLKSTEDQVTRITQIIVDGLNDNTGTQRRGKRTVMALIDFSRAFYKVSHMGLLWKMSKMKCPPCLLKTTKAFLSNRQSRVRFEGKTSHYKKFTGGVPQGGVLSPTLFLIFINDISSNLPEGVEVSLFSDDLALLAQNEDLEQASSLLQQGLECIEKWSKKWKMTLNVDKCEVTHFSKWTKEASWRPNVKLLDRRMKYSDSPTFLGVTFDRQLTFRKHVDKIKEKANKRLNVLRCLSGKSWRAGKEDLRIVYLAYIKSAIDYASNAWYTCLDKDSRQKSLKKLGKIISIEIGSTGFSESSAYDRLSNIYARKKPVTKEPKLLAETTLELEKRPVAL
ncbi:RNA-directed DNA polymerase from mobile element jockey-like [Elysia marginata]|uniref:RNA-directed DNA polymerase from mobile element jockey-like n=1 Tax=Elysia marginata TaxID=1093978 RepID=A0AAV4ELJ6_9GAST|nr:RNA-directed DNA polymerase from mobile element jockey-like [Elysia marginata]